MYNTPKNVFRFVVDISISSNLLHLTIAGSFGANLFYGIKQNVSCKKYR